MRFLLDKVTARRILEGLLKLAEARDLTAEEIVALDLYERAGSDGLRQFMVPSTGSTVILSPRRCSLVGGSGY
jgi:hypothetical protein